MKKPKYTGKNTLDAAMKLVKSTMQYVDGSANVSFTIDNSGEVTALRLVNNLDAPKETAK